MKNMTKLAIAISISFLIIISSIMVALSILKDEAVNNYVTISKLNANASSKELNQDINNIEQSILTIPSLLDLYKNKKDINISLKHIQKNYPQIRSINILKDSKIIYSSNDYNMGIFIKNLNLYPKPIFDDNVLRISIPWVGRDFVDGDKTYNYKKEIDVNDSFLFQFQKK